MARRHWSWVAAATAMLVFGVGAVLTVVYPYARWTEDFFPGRAPDIALEPDAWTVTDDALTFAVVGDTGTGGRNAMDVARQMAETYRDSPYGVVIHVGDISYYGSVADRWREVFVEPFGPLLDAGVQFEMAVGNHELEEVPSEEADREIAETLRLIGSEGRYYRTRYGPVDFFIIDSSTPLITGAAAEEQRVWLERELAASDAPWKVAALHHPPYASGPKRGSNLEVREVVEPLFVEYGVQLVLTGHDHFYERSHPQQGIVYVVSGAGAKLSDVGSADFTAVSEKALQFMIGRVDGDAMRMQAIDEAGEVIDDFTIRRSAP